MLNMYMLKVNNGIIRERCEICSKLKIKTPKQRQVDFEQLFVHVDFEQLCRIPWGKKILVDYKTSFQLPEIFTRVP